MAGDDYERVGDLVTLVRGTTYKGALVGKPGPALLGLGSIVPGGGFRVSDFKTYGGECPEQLMLRPGDLYVSLKGATKDGEMIGSVAQVPSQVASGRLTQDTVKLAIAPEFEELRQYLYWLLRTPQYRAYCAGCARGSAVVALSRDDFLAYPVPRFTAFRATVVALLESLDDKIELNRRMNETLEAMAQVVFRDWFVDFGPTRRKLEGATDPLTIMGGLVQDTDRAQALADLFPAALGDDGLPDGWTEKAFGAFVEILGGGTPKTSNEGYWNGSIPWFSVTDTPTKGSIFVDVTEKTISDQGLANSSARLVRAGTTIISARGTVGNLALSPHEMTFNQSCYGLQGKGAVGDCFVFLAAQNIVERLKGMAHGSVFSTITRSTFDNIQLSYALDEIFEAFESLARPMFDKVLGNVKESRTLAATRDLLLPKLMSGEIRLSEAEDLLEAAQ